MPDRETIQARLTEPGVIAVVRAARADLLPPLAEALVAGGIVAIEITLTVPEALGAIRATRARLGDRALVGVGSVVDAGAARAALAAGAEFVVSPIGRPDSADLSGRVLP